MYWVIAVIAIIIMFSSYYPITLRLVYADNNFQLYWRPFTTGWELDISKYLRSQHKSKLESLYTGYYEIKSLFRFLPYVCLRFLRLDIKVGGDNPFNIALKSGLIQSSMGIFFSNVCSRLKKIIEQPQLAVIPDYSADHSKFSLECILTARTGDIILKIVSGTFPLKGRMK